MKFSLIIPCYNEAKSLGNLVERCQALAKRADVEVILVDNGSTDNTPSILPKIIADHTHIRSVRVEKNQGYGFGILSGLREAKGEVMGWTHADLQTDPGDALKGMEFFENSEDPRRIFVKGKRYGRSLFSTLFTVGMSFFEMFLLRRFLWDINAQPTMFHRQLYQSWHSAPFDFSLDLYAYYQAKLNGCEIKRFPVFFGKRVHGTSHWDMGLKSKYKFIRRTVSYSIALKRSLSVR